MLTAVHIYNDKNDTLELPLDDSSEYVVKSIEGLGPVKADIITTSYVGIDGGSYQNAKGNMRNIVIQLGFDPSYESDDPFGELRRGLYPWLTPKMQVEMRFLSSNFETVKIVGYVESFEPSIFSAEPEVQISILCPDPYFNSLVPITVSRIGSGILTFNNPGTATVGFTLNTDYFTPTTPSVPLVITQTGPSQVLKTMSIIANTFPTNSLRLIFNTNKGYKDVYWYMIGDAGDPEDWMHIPGFVTDWLELSPGNNDINVILGITTTPVVLTLGFTPRYSGL